MLGAANFEGGPLLHIASGNLGFQIEHHLFPDLPSNRYAEIAVKVRALCDKYDLPYTTGPLHRQYGQALRTIIKLSVPNSWTSTRPAGAADPVDRPQPQDRRRAADPEVRARRLVARGRGGAGMTVVTQLFAWGDSLDDLVGARVTQCALSRICGGCGRPLGRPIAFVGTATEVGRNAFHAPPLHLVLRAATWSPGEGTGSWSRPPASSSSGRAARTSTGDRRSSRTRCIT